MPPLKEALLKIPTLLEVSLSICNWREMVLRKILRQKKILWCLEHQKSIISHEEPLKSCANHCSDISFCRGSLMSDPWHEGGLWNKKWRCSIKEFRCNTMPGSFLWHLCVFSKCSKEHQRPEKCLFHFKVMVFLWYLEGSIPSLSNLHARLII